MIPILERAVSDKKKWVKKEEMTDMLVIAQTIPGSIAVNTATFIGYRLAGVLGAIAGTLGIITPTFIIIVLLASLFLSFQHYPIVQAAIMGIRPAVVALIVYASINIGKKSLIDLTTILIAIFSVVLLLLVDVHPILILLIGGLVGILLNVKNIKKVEKREKESSTLKK